MPKFSKDCLRPGSYRLGDGRWVTFTRDDIHALADRVNRMLAAGLNIPVTLEHDRAAVPLSAEERRINECRAVIGWVDGATLDGDTLIARLTIDDPADAATARKCRFISPYVLRSFIDGAGHDLQSAIAHVAVTPFPVQHNQQPFKLLALSRAGYCLSLSRGAFAPERRSTMRDTSRTPKTMPRDLERPETTMPDGVEQPQTVEELKANLDKMIEEAGDDLEAAITAVRNYLDQMHPEEEEEGDEQFTADAGNAQPQPSYTAFSRRGHDAVPDLGRYMTSVRQPRGRNSH